MRCLFTLRDKNATIVGYKRQKIVQGQTSGEGQTLPSFCYYH